MKTKTIAGLALMTLLLAGSAPLAQQTTGTNNDNARIEKFKAAVVEGIESRRKLAQVMNDTVFSFGELAYQEVETSKYLTDVLEQNGFLVERDIAGMPTAWVARWGSGSPVIAIGSDIDCLPKASQKPGVAYREPLVEGAPGHGEGHNSGQAVNIVAALAVKDLMEREKIAGTLLICRALPKSFWAARPTWYAPASSAASMRCCSPMSATKWRPPGDSRAEPAWFRSNTRSRANPRTPRRRHGAGAMRCARSN
jgi:aminobenzoyl-glutamate utilization protein B